MHLNALEFVVNQKKECINFNTVSDITEFKPKFSINPVVSEGREFKELCESVSSEDNSLFLTVSEVAGPHGFTHSSSSCG